MIEKIVLENFEGHVHTELELSHGVYIISGNSSAGKSSIFRALKSVIKNSSAGEDSINFNAQEYCVTIVYDGHVVKRIRARNNKKNEYWVDGKLLKAFGQSVPEEVQAVFGLSDINFEWQFDKRPFLIAETGGYIASKLNEIVNLELIDSSLRNIESTRRENNKNIESAEGQVKDIQKKIDAFDWIEQAEEDLKAVEGLQRAYSNTEHKVDMLRIAIGSIEHNEDMLDELLIISEDEIDEVSINLKKYEEHSKRCCALEKTIREITESNAKVMELQLIEQPLIDDLQARIQNVLKWDRECQSHKNLIAFLTLYEKKLEDVGELVSERRIVKLDGVIKEYLSSEKKINNISSVLVQYKTLIKRQSELQEEIQELQEEYKKIAPDVCPLCGGQFNKELGNEVNIHN